MSITATYVSATSFTVVGDMTDSFWVGRQVRADCGVDGIKYGSVVGAAYGAPNTTVVIHPTIKTASALTANLINVLYGFDSPQSVIHPLLAVKEMTFTGVGASPTYVNLFKITETIAVVGFYADVYSALAGDIGTGYLQLYDGTNTIDVTDAPGPSFNSLPVESYIHKIDDAGVNIKIENSSQVRMYEDATKDGRDPNFTITQKNGVDTFLRFVYSDNGASGVLHWHLFYEKRCDGGLVEAV